VATGACSHSYFTFMTGSLWMNLQTRYDLEIEWDRLGPSLNDIRPMETAS
jgi:plasmid maintenance system antidote protein VapI